MGAPRSLAPPPRGPAADLLQLSGSHSQTSGHASQGSLYETDDFSLKFFWVLTLLRMWRDNYQGEIVEKLSRENICWPHLWVHGLSQGGPRATIGTLQNR
jgi:hypothetical protein